MYKVEVLSRGKHNIELGARYYLFKSDAQNFVKNLKSEDCRFVVKKFTRLYFGAYCWSEVEVHLSDFFNLDD